VVGRHAAVDRARGRELSYAAAEAGRDALSPVAGAGHYVKRIDRITPEDYDDG
jgi:hypothetical protein